MLSVQFGIQFHDFDHRSEILELESLFLITTFNHEKKTWKEKQIPEFSYLHSPGLLMGCARGIKKIQ